MRHPHIHAEKGLKVEGYQVIRFSKMATVKTFEGLEVWQHARKLVKEIYGVSNRGPFSKDFGLRDQLRRASISILSNIAEGFERSGNKEFAHFLFMAKGSAGELRAQLYVALDLAYISANDFQPGQLFGNNRPTTFCVDQVSAASDRQNLIT
jgi:four helix bundle protein